MKKTIFIFLTLFIFIPNLQALSKFDISEKVPNMSIESINDNSIPIIKRDDGQFIYSLNPSKTINENEYYQEYYDNNKLFNLTDKQLERINLLAYYGYGYENHTDIKWYGVTQFLIWKTLDNSISFTDNKYQEEINEIEQSVKNYSTLPSVANKSYELSIDTGYMLYDHSKVIDNYEIKSSNIGAYIEDNNLYIKRTKEEGNYEITLIRKSPIDRNYILYGLNDSNNLIYNGRVKDKEVKVYIKISGGSITINKLDSENKEREFATLEGTEYGVYNNGHKLIDKIKTNKEGIAFIDKLPWNQSYYIEELTPGRGYKLDENSYKVELTRDKKNISINSYGSIIQGSLLINKYYCKEDDCKLEDGAKFEIYDINNKLIGNYETKDGIINIKLEYGKYYGVQCYGIDGYDYVDNFEISIEEEKGYAIDLYSNKKEEDVFIEEVPENNKKEEDVLIVEVPDTKKIDYEIFISIIFIIIGLILVFKSKKKTTH